MQNQRPKFSSALAYVGCVNGLAIGISGMYAFAIAEVTAGTWFGLAAGLAVGGFCIYMMMRWIAHNEDLFLRQRFHPPGIIQYYRQYPWQLVLIFGGIFGSMWLDEDYGPGAPAAAVMGAFLAMLMLYPQQARLNRRYRRIEDGLEPMPEPDRL